MKRAQTPHSEITKLLKALLAHEKRHGAGPVPTHLIPLNKHRFQRKARRLATEQGLALYVPHDAVIAPSARSGWLLTDKGRAYLQELATK